MEEQHLATLLSVAKKVVELWEGGDLAAAVSHLARSIEDHESWTKYKGHLTTKETMVLIPKVEVENILAFYGPDEERHYNENPSDNHAWLLLKKLRESMEKSPLPSHTQCYLLLTWDNKDSHLLGPFKTSDQRDREALRLYARQGQGQNIHMLDIKDGMPFMKAYDACFFLNDK